MINSKEKEKEKTRFLAETEYEELELLVASGQGAKTTIALANKIFDLAVSHHASDVHIEPTSNAGIVRLRIDGVLHDVITLPRDILVTLIARVKILSELKIDEHRVPQDGRFTGNLKSGLVGFRVSIIPVLSGEKVAIRILPQETRHETLEDLGLSPAAKTILETNLRRPYGMLLVCGPTGSGKTTTLYTLLQNLIREKGTSVNINTIENPVEYTLERVNQIQVSPEVGLTFHSALRGLLRQDTDIVMVGEIRDRETAQAAIQASLTGRLLLSSLHTRNAVGTIIRLLDIGIEPYLISSALTVTAAQRLIRLNCTSCITSYPIDEKLLAELENRYHLSEVIERIKKNNAGSKQLEKPLKLYRGQGCETCHFTGYRGRTGIYEVLKISEPIRKLVQLRSPSSELHKQAAKEGMATMFQDGFEKALMGKTTLEEVLRVSLE